MQHGQQNIILRCSTVSKTLKLIKDITSQVMLNTDDIVPYGHRQIICIISRKKKREIKFISMSLAKRCPDFIFEK
jgi:hypothetical protein